MRFTSTGIWGLQGFDVVHADTLGTDSADRSLLSILKKPAIKPKPKPTPKPVAPPATQQLTLVGKGSKTKTSIKKSGKGKNVVSTPVIQVTGGATVGTTVG